MNIVNVYKVQPVGPEEQVLWKNGFHLNKRVVNGSPRPISQEHPCVVSLGVQITDFSRPAIRYGSALGLVRYALEVDFFRKTYLIITFVIFNSCLIFF